MLKRFMAILVVMSMAISVASVCFADEGANQVNRINAKKQANEAAMRLGGGDSHYVISTINPKSWISKSKISEIAGKNYSAYVSNDDYTQWYIAFEAVGTAFGIRVPSAGSVIGTWQQVTGLNRYYFRDSSDFYLQCMSQMNAMHTNSIQITQKYCMYEFTNGRYLPVAGPRIVN